MAGLTPEDSALAYIGMILQGTVLDSLKAGGVLHGLLYLLAFFLLLYLLWGIFRRDALRPFIHIALAGLLLTAFLTLDGSPPGVSIVGTNDTVDANASAQNVVGTFSLPSPIKSPVFEAIAGGMDGIVFGIMNRMDAVFGPPYFSGAPFLLVRAIQTATIEQIDDEPLRNNLSTFMNLCYGPIAARVLNAGGQFQTGDYDQIYQNIQTYGPQIVIPPVQVNGTSYENCGDLWTAVESEMGTWADQKFTENNGFLDTASTLLSSLGWFTNPRQYFQNLMMSSAIRHQVVEGQTQPDLANPSGAEQDRESFRDLLGWVTRVIFRGIGWIATDTLGKAFLELAPRAIGWITMILYALFPLALLISLFPRATVTLPVYFLSLLWVKSFYLIYFLIDKFQTAFLRVQDALALTPDPISIGSAALIDSMNWDLWTFSLALLFGAGAISFVAIFGLAHGLTRVVSLPSTPSLRRPNV